MLFIFCTISLAYLLFHPFPRFIICHPVCCDEKCFILFILVFGLVAIIVLLLLLACSPSLLRALIIFIIIRPLFRIKQIGLETVLRSFLSGLIFNFPNPLDLKTVSNPIFLILKRGLIMIKIISARRSEGEKNIVPF